MEVLWARRRRRCGIWTSPGSFSVSSSRTSWQKDRCDRRTFHQTTSWICLSVFSSLDSGGNFTGYLQVVSTFTKTTTTTRTTLSSAALCLELDDDLGQFRSLDPSRFADACVFRNHYKQTLWLDIDKCTWQSWNRVLDWLTARPERLFSTLRCGDDGVSVSHSVELSYAVISESRGRINNATEKGFQSPNMQT